MPDVCRVWMLFRVESGKSGIQVSAEHAFVIGKLYSFDKVYYFSYVLLIMEVMVDGWPRASK